MFKILKNLFNFDDHILYRAAGSAELLLNK